MLYVFLRRRLKAELEIDFHGTAPAANTVCLPVAASGDRVGHRWILRMRDLLLAARVMGAAGHSTFPMAGPVVAQAPVGRRRDAAVDRPLGKGREYAPAIAAEVGNHGRGSGYAQ